MCRYLVKDVQILGQRCAYTLPFICTYLPMVVLLAIYDYVVPYVVYQAHIWCYLVHLYVQKIGILTIFLVNFR